jgi:hypothetical protein
VLAGMQLPRQQAYHLAVADTLERIYGKSVKDRAGEIAYHLYQAGTAANPVRTSSFLAQAARNALAVAAFEEGLQLIESELLLLPGDKIRDRADALAMRGEALTGVGRRDDARTAWSAAAQRYDELGDKKAAADVRRRLGSPSTAEEESTSSEQPAEPSVEAAAVEPPAEAASADPTVEAAPNGAVAAPEGQETSLAAGGTGA